jgi:hypothetical protein
VAVTVRAVPARFRRLVAERPEEWWNPEAAALPGRVAGGRSAGTGDERSDSLVVVRGVLRAGGDGPVSELVAAGTR